MKYLFKQTRKKFQVLKREAEKYKLEKVKELSNRIEKQKSSNWKR